MRNKRLKGAICTHERDSKRKTYGVLFSFWGLTPDSTGAKNLAIVCSSPRIARILFTLGLELSSIFFIK